MATKKKTGKQYTLLRDIVFGDGEVGEVEVGSTTPKGSVVSLDPEHAVTKALLSKSEIKEGDAGTPKPVEAAQEEGGGSSSGSGGS